MADLIYRAKSYYQFSYIWELYKILGGKFIQQNPRNFDLLQNRVGSDNCFFMQRSRTLPNKNTSLVLEMTLHRKYYLRREKYFKNVLIYHGMGLDKNFKGRNFPVNRYDYYFVSGEKDFLRYKHYSYGLNDLRKRIVRIGHLRSDLIINKCYDIEATLNRISIVDRTRRNILFAPTWSRGHGSLLLNYMKFCDQITKEYNLLIRTHPYDIDNYTEVRDYIYRKKIRNVYLIDPDEIPLIDNLAVADLLIADNSSLMYDWLFFDKPLITVKTIDTDLEKYRHLTHDRFLANTCGYFYIPGENNINTLIGDSFMKNPFAERIGYVRDNTFYFNDGKANERSLNWIKEKLSEF